MGAVLAAGTLLLLATVPARAQQPRPLTKSDVVRLLVDPAYSPSDVTGIVRRNCLGFRPTSADMDDFRRLGASAETLDAIRTCASRAPGGRTKAAPARQLHLELSRDSLHARAGELVVFAARVDSGGIPAPGVTLVIRGSGELPGGAGSDVAAVTDSGGTALFRLPAGRSPGRYDLQVAGDGRSLSGSGAVALLVRPGAPDHAVVRPESLEVGPGAPDSVPVSVHVADAFGNAVPSSSVELRLTGPGAPRRGWGTSTDANGAATIRVPSASLRARDTVAVIADGQRLASLPISAASGAARARAPAVGSDSLALLRGRADSLLVSGEPGPAERLYGEILAARPEDPGALAGRGRALLALGRAGEAADALRASLAADPGQADVWVELGKSYEAAGQSAAARQAYEQALAAEPGLPEAERALARLGGPALASPVLRASVWGGYTAETATGVNGRSAGLRRAELRIQPTPTFALWGRYDNALNLEHPELVRGEVDFKSWWGGAGGSYGDGERFTTRAEFGRRKMPPAMTVETMWWLQQTVRFGSGSVDPFLRPSVHASGLLGHWFDRDDWVVEGGAGLPVGRYVRLEPRVSYGKLVGTVSSSERIPAKDARFGLGAWIRPAPGWRIEPTLTYGHVSAPTSAMSGSLFDGTLRLAVPVGRFGGVEAFARYQDPPGRAGFGQLGLGLWGAVPR